MWEIRKNVLRWEVLTDGSIGQIDGAASEFQTDLGYRMYVPLPYVSGAQARSRRPREPPTPAHIGRVLSKICIPALEPQEAPSLLLLHAM